MTTRGFTLLELLLVIAIITLLAGGSAPFVSSALLRYQGLTAQDRVMGALHKAQVYSLDHRLGTHWGVCVTSGQLRLYAGSCATPTFQENWLIPSGVSITGFSDLTFSAYRGEPSSTPTITIATQITSSQIILNAIGGLNVN